MSCKQSKKVIKSYTSAPCKEGGKLVEDATSNCILSSPKPSSFALFLAYSIDGIWLSNP